MLQFVEVETSKRGRVTTVSMDGYTNRKTLLGVVHEVGREVAKYDENEGRGLLDVKTEREAKECFQKNILDPETYCFELEEVECASYFDEGTDQVIYGEAATYYFYIRFFIWDEVEEKPEEPETVKESKEEKGENKMQVYGEWFYGNKISDYGLKNGYVDYGTLAKAFDAVLNNDIVERTMSAGFDWEIVSGFVDNSERIEEINADIEELEQDAENYRDRAADAFDAGNLEECDELEKSAERCADRLEELREELEELEREQDETPEIFQWYIVSDGGAEILQEVNEMVYYCSELDMYVWGVTHYGTAWSHVLTNIPCNTGKF